MVYGLGYHYCTPDMAIGGQIILLNISISILQLIVPVLCWFTSPLVHPVCLSFLAMLVCIPNFLSLSSGVDLLPSLLSVNYHSIQWFTVCGDGRAGQPICSLISQDICVSGYIQ